MVVVVISDGSGTEFGGGALTGPLTSLNNSGGLLFLLALILTLIYPRVATICALVASLLCLPLYLYLASPGPFYRMFPIGALGRHSLPNFVWDDWALIGILLLPVWPMSVCAVF